MMFFIGWIIFSFVAGFVGSDRKIGFWGAFLLSIFLSPLIGLIIAFSSKSNTEIQYQEELLRTQKQQQTTLEQMANSNEIEQLFNLMKKGILTEEEFNQKKKNLLGLDNLGGDKSNLTDDTNQAELSAKIGESYDFDKSTIATLETIKSNEKKEILLDTIIQYLKTYSISSDLRTNHPLIVNDVVSGKYNLKPLESIFTAHKGQLQELLSIEQQMKKYILS